MLSLHKLGIVQFCACANSLQTAFPPARHVASLAILALAQYILLVFEALLAVEV